MVKGKEMDLFEMLGDPGPEHKAPNPKPSSDEIINELVLIVKEKYDLNMTLACAKDIASLFLDPPPWKPWS